MFLFRLFLFDNVAIFFVKILQPRVWSRALPSHVSLVDRLFKTRNAGHLCSSDKDSILQSNDSRHQFITFVSALTSTRFSRHLSTPLITEWFLLVLQRNTIVAVRLHQ